MVLRVSHQFLPRPLAISVGVPRDASPPHDLGYFSRPRIPSVPSRHHFVPLVWRFRKLHVRRILKVSQAHGRPRVLARSALDGVQPEYGHEIIAAPRVVVGVEYQRNFPLGQGLQPGGFGRVGRRHLHGALDQRDEHARPSPRAQHRPVLYYVRPHLGPQTDRVGRELHAANGVIVGGDGSQRVLAVPKSGEDGYEFGRVQRIGPAG
mmetsp:Transcript_22912/g.55239  ORF Transcript_22912/g.55239 Transcript_22912/m.55239 type:complete len:207 (+) Transcript_22912:267-887(+)